MESSENTVLLSQSSSSATGYSFSTGLLAITLVATLSVIAGGALGALVYSRTSSPAPAPSPLPHGCPLQSLQDVPDFGKQMRACWFSHLQQNWTFLNHGSYGAAPTAAIAGAARYRDRSQENADVWFRMEMVPELVAARKEVAAYVGAGDFNTIVLVDDVTEGINSVLRSLSPPPPGTRVLRSSVAYLMVQNTVDYLLGSEAWPGVLLDVAAIPWPLSDEEAQNILLAAIRDENAPVVSVLLLDHISSSPAIVFDVAELARAALEMNSECVVLVDGAHAFGQIPLNLSELAESGIAYYTGNGHKWLAAERGGAFLYAAPGREIGMIKEEKWQGYINSVKGGQ